MLKKHIARIKSYIPGPVKEAALAGRRLPRQLTSRLRMLPGYILFGSMRSGTSSLYHNLSDHPNVLPALRKQVRYFDAHHARGLNWYRAHFPTLRAARNAERSHGRPVITGEASPEYIFHPLAPDRIARALPQVRLIALLRDPVDRAWSHYHHSVRNGLEPLSFEDALEAESQRLGGEQQRAVAGGTPQCHECHQHGYLTQGAYADFLPRWFEHFAREQVLILRSEDLFDDPAGSMGRVCDFLGLPDWGAPDWAALNAGSQRPMEPALRERLLEHFRPHNERLAELLGRGMGWDQ